MTYGCDERLFFIPPLIINDILQEALFLFSIELVWIMIQVLELVIYCAKNFTFFYERK